MSETVQRLRHGPDSNTKIRRIAGTAPMLMRREMFFSRRLPGAYLYYLWQKYYIDEPEAQNN